MNFWLCRFRGSVDSYFSLTQKHRDVEEADLTTSVTPRIRVSGTVIVCCPLVHATPRHRARAEVFATDLSKLNQQFGLPAGEEGIRTSGAVCLTHPDGLLTVD